MGIFAPKLPKNLIQTNVIQLKDVVLSSRSNLKSNHLTGYKVLKRGKAAFKRCLKCTDKQVQFVSYSDTRQRFSMTTIYAKRRLNV